MTGTYDPETDTGLLGRRQSVSGPRRDERQGDNLYSASVLALRADTGALKWHYQFTPHDLYDWDAGRLRWW